MAIQYFLAIVERGGDGGFGVFFPDLPGCVGAGDTIVAAVQSAEKALDMHLRGLVEDDEPVPAQREFGDVPRDPEVDEVARVIIRGDLLGKAVRFNASMEEGLLARVDADAKAKGMNRSAYLAEGARRMLEA